MMLGMSSSSLVLDPPAVESSPVNQGSWLPAGGLTTVVLEAELYGLSARIAAATSRWLEMVGEYDAREAWAQWECRSMAHWMVGHLGESLVTAREHVRVAAALRKFPVLRQTFAEGRLSYARVRAVSRVMDASNEAELVTLAIATTASQLERFVSVAARLTVNDKPDSADDLFERRSMLLRQNDDDTWELRATLPTDAGIILRGLLRERENEFRSEHPNEVVRGDQRLCDAFAALVAYAAETQPDTDGDESDDVGKPRSEHDSAESFDDFDSVEAGTDSPIGPADALLDDSAESSKTVKSTSKRRPKKPKNGRFTERRRRPLVVINRFPDGDLLGRFAIPSTTADRHECDSFCIDLDHTADGDPLNFGRMRRFPTAAQRRTVLQRDQSCCFPGCNSRLNLHIHHIIEWGQSGTTDVINLIALCGWHHRIIHDQHWTITGQPGGALTFTRPERENQRGLSTQLATEPFDIERLIADILNRHQVDYATDDLHNDDADNDYSDNDYSDNDHSHNDYSHNDYQRQVDAYEPTNYGRQRIDTIRPTGIDRFDLGYAVSNHLANQENRLRRAQRQPPTTKAHPTHEFQTPLRA